MFQPYLHFPRQKNPKKTQTTHLLLLLLYQSFFFFHGGHNSILTLLRITSQPTIFISDCSLAYSSPAATICLISADSRVNHFDRPIPTSRRMEQHHLHLICHSDSLFLGRKVPALSALDRLQLGHSYFLLPSHFFHSILSFVTLISSSSFVRSFDIEKTEKRMVRVRVKDEALAGDGDVSGRKHFSARGGVLDEEERRRLRGCDSEELEEECGLIGMRSWREGMLELEKEVPRRWKFLGKE